MVTKCEDLDDPDDCTICLFIPYKKFNTLPVNEIRRIKAQATLEISHKRLNERNLIE